MSIPAKQLIRQGILWAYWHPLAKLLNALPVPLMYGFAGMLGSLHYSLAGSKRKALRNEWHFLAQKADPEEDCESAVHRSFQIHLQGEAEMFRYGKMSSRHLEKYIVCQGIEHVDNALARQHGVMLAFGHFGANKMIMAAMGHRGYTMNQLSTPPTVWIEKLVDRNMNGMARHDLELRWQADCMLPSRHINIFGSMRPAFKCLKNHELLGVAIDGAGGSNKIELDWNGHQAIFSTGAMDLALRTDAIILPVYVKREKSGKNIMVIEEQINQNGCNSPEDLTRAAAARHAAHALASPSHYIKFMAWRRYMQSIDGSGLFVA